ncbi:flagellar basal-body protein FlbY [Terricaulis sp.]|uniref:flagellar basal-body protein FlbY n=1 Tax=Terricaulis sp. TaxID=2768686 RepID=UPI003782EEF3
MALLAEDPADRVEQMLLLTDRLASLIEEETRRIEARLPPLDGAEGEEKNRLANAYRLELARIKHDRAMIESAPPTSLAALKVRTARLQDALAAHETALGAVKFVAEGLVQAMAEDVARQRNGARNYGAGGGLAAPTGPSPAVLDKSA